MDTYHLMEDPWLSPQGSLQQYQYEDVSLAWLYTQIRIKIRIKHQLHQNLLLTLIFIPRSDSSASYKGSLSATQRVH